MSPQQSWACWYGVGNWPTLSDLSMRQVVADRSRCYRNASGAPDYLVSPPFHSPVINTGADVADVEHWMFGEQARPAHAYFLRFVPDVLQRGGLWGYLDAQQMQTPLQLETSGYAAVVGNIYNFTSGQYEPVTGERCKCRYSIPAALRPEVAMYGATPLAAAVRDMLPTLSVVTFWAIISKEAFKLVAFFALFMRAATRRSFWIHFASKHVLSAPCWLLYGKAYRETYLSPTLFNGAPDSSIALRSGFLDFLLQTIPMLLINIAMSLADADSGFQVRPLTVVTLLFNSLNMLVTIVLLVGTCSRALAAAKHELKLPQTKQTSEANAIQMTNVNVRPRDSGWTGAADPRMMP